MKKVLNDYIDSANTIDYIFMVAAVSDYLIQVPHKNKIKRGFKKIINLMGADHHGYVPRMEAVLQAMGYDKNIFKILGFTIKIFPLSLRKISFDFVFLRLKNFFKLFSNENIFQDQKYLCIFAADSLKIRERCMCRERQVALDL